MVEPYEDPDHPFNGPIYRVGKRCIEEDCANEAGTGWSKYWCPECNAKRMKCIDNQMRSIAKV